MPRIYSRNRDSPFYEVKFYSRQDHGPNRFGTKIVANRKLNFFRLEISSKFHQKEQFEIVEISFLSSDYRIFLDGSEV